MDEEETQRNKVAKQMKGAVDPENSVDRGSPRTTIPASDENENQIQGSVSGHRQAQQECVNNNKTDPHSKTGDSRGLAQGLKNSKAANCSDSPSANTEGVKGKGTSPKSNGKHKKGMKADSSGVVPEACTVVAFDGISNGCQWPGEEEEEEEEEEGDRDRDRDRDGYGDVLQSLFSLLQGGMEQSDSSVLPQCLHQVL
ncbi:UNVERIFIED_CONTAM: hypothetical protein FKN15_017026 [Acipenser sinensis]